LAYFLIGNLSRLSRVLENQRQIDFDKGRVTRSMKILGICGSVRKASYNRGLLRAAQEEAPAGVDVEICSIADIELYNADVERTGVPEPVAAFKNAIAEADALLIACPEYNGSFTGVLKNAIDWASRPVASCPLNGKPAALLGASGGPSGTARAQAALLPVLNACGVITMPKPGVVVRHSATLFDEHVNLTDQDTRDRIRQQVEALVSFARKIDG
jgi:chromate reductase, NAD(P)H dehydrogenase (quinone)